MQGQGKGREENIISKGTQRARMRRTSADRAEQSRQWWGGKCFVSGPKLSLALSEDLVMVASAGVKGEKWWGL